jgi:hypothetical protein
MAWKAIIESVLDNPVPNDTITVNVRFTDGAKEYRQTFSYRSGCTQDDIVAELRKHVGGLDEFEPVKTSLKALIGQEIVAEIR